MPSTSPTSGSLVKYANAVLATEYKNKHRRHPKISGDHVTAQYYTNKPATNNSGTVVFDETDPYDVPPVEDILNMILPPITFEDNKQIWKQPVSPAPATRLDVVSLQEHLDTRLQHRKALDCGICPIREELYAQAFDEVIRQVSVGCAERGLLLLRLRDESRGTLQCYKELYNSSIACGMRKTLQSENSKEKLQSTIRALEREREDLMRQVVELSQKCEQLGKDEEERKLADKHKQKDDCAALRKILQLKMQQLHVDVIMPHGKK